MSESGPSSPDQDRFKPATFTPPPPGQPPDAPPPPPPPIGGPGGPKTAFKDGVLRGFLFGLLAHSIQVILGAVTGGISLLVIGLSQLIYMIPLQIYFGRQGLPLTAKGLLICTGVTFLLNAACVGLVLIALGNASFR